MRGAPGWVQSKARNRALIFKNRLGRLEWFETNRINIWIRKPAGPGKLSQLLSDGFFKTGLIEDPRVLEAFIHSVKFQGAHAVYDLGVTLPYARFEDFKDGNAIVVKMGDRSDPTSVEFEFHRPKWAEEMRETMAAFIDTMKKLTEPGAPGPVKKIGVV